MSIHTYRVNGKFAKKPDVQEKIIAYKGFNKDLKCRDFQFEIGKTYIHKGKVKSCNSGFHSCLNPFDVLNYYDITSRFAMVEIGGNIITHGSDSKIASAEITVIEELKLSEFITTCIKWLLDYCNGDESKQAQNGDYSKQAQNGNCSNQAQNGDYSNQAQNGNCSKQAQNGSYSNQSQNGDYSKQAQNGNCSKQAQNGSYSNQSQNGDYSKQAQNGNCSKQAQNGNCSNQAQNGNCSNQAQNGSYSNQSQNGDYSKQAQNGDCSKQAQNGNCSKQESNGLSSISVSTGLYGKVKVGHKGTAVLTRWIESEKRYRVSVGYEGENIKAGIWYELDYSGNFVETTE